MSTSGFLFLIAAFWVLGAVQTGALMWVSTKVVRLKNLSLKRAIVWGLAASVVDIAASVVSEFASPDIGDLIEGLVGLAIIITIAVLFKRIGACGKGRAISATLIWAVLWMVMWVAEFLIVQATIAAPYSQTNEAMAPTLLDGDEFLVDRTKRADRFDLIVFRPPHDHSTVYVSRLIGLPGETVEIIDGRVHIDGKAIPLPAGVPDIAYKSDFPNWPSAVGVEGNAIRLGDDEYFILGDNTANSRDSRLWPASNGKQAGALPEANIVGVVRMIYSPLTRFRLFR